MYRLIHITLIVVFLPFIMGIKSPSNSYSVKLAYIEKFTRFIRWSPENTIDTINGFKIGIITPNPFKEEIKKFTALNKIKGNAIQYVEITSLRQLPKVNIVFIPNGHDFSLETILEKFKEQRPIIISERKNYAKKGTHINFYTENNRIRFEINYDEVEKGGYTISQQLLKIAKIVS